MPDKTANSAAKFLLEDVIEPCPYLIECVYSDNENIKGHFIIHLVLSVLRTELIKNLLN